MAYSLILESKGDKLSSSAECSIRTITTVNDVCPFQGTISRQRLVTCRFVTLYLYLFELCFLSALELKILRTRERLTFVPQDVNISVTELVLGHNEIVTLDDTSFVLYDKMKSVLVDDNPLRFIRDGTFDNNPSLRGFSCKRCKIESLPASFGPSTNAVNQLNFGGGIADPSIIRSPYFVGFPSLLDLNIGGIALRTMDNISLPLKMRWICVVDCGLQKFPNFTSEGFLRLHTIWIQRNPFTDIPDSLLSGMTKSIKSLVSYNGDLDTIGDLTLLSNLELLSLYGNNLETIPDLLRGVPNLRRLSIDQNRRMFCDRRMCWWRLWERVRAPLERSSDVICQQPETLSGFPMSTVNPKFMNCNEGRWHLLKMFH